MQSPPDRRTPPILLMRPAYEWISRVNQKHRQLAGLQLSAEQKELLDRWSETEFVCSTLTLEGAVVERARVAQLASSASGADSIAESDRAAHSLLESLRVVTSVARAEGEAATLSVDLLLKLHGATGASSINSTTSAVEASTERVLGERALLALDGACRWFAADSFTELHPVEQASILLLRLIDISAFEQGNEQTALVAASLFTLRSELPPIIIKPEMHSAYRAALDEGVRMNTKPMVELVAEAVEASCTEMILL